MSRQSRPLGALLAVLLLAACSSGGNDAAPTTTTTSPESSSSSSSRSTPPRKADDATWVGQGPKPVSQLVGAGGHIVYLGVDDDNQLQLIGLEPSTGAVAWQRPSTTASHIGGVQQTLVADGDLVFNVEPPGGGDGSRVAYPAQADAGFDVVAVDARTGEDEWRQDFDDVLTPLARCARDLCVSAADEEGRLHIARLDTATGLFASRTSNAFEPLVATDGDTAISASRTDDAIVLTSDFGNDVVWTHSRAELFGTNDVTPDGGWSGFHSGGVWVVWLGGASPSLGATSGISDVGDLLWTHAGTAPCFPFTNDPMTSPVLCGELDAAAQRITVGTVEGIDTATGATQWSLSVGDVDVQNLGASLVRLTSSDYAVRTPDGDIAVDLITGPSGAPAAPTDGWCESLGQFTEVEGDRHIVATSWSPCTLGEGPNDTPPTSVPDFAGPTVNGYGAWVEDGEVRAAKVD